MAEEPEEDSIDDAPTVVELVGSGSGSNSSSTYCIHKYFGSDNCWNNSNGNGNSNSSNSSRVLVSDNGNGLIQTQLDDIIDNVRCNIITQARKSDDDNPSDDNTTSTSHASMPFLMCPG